MLACFGSRTVLWLSSSSVTCDGPSRVATRLLRGSTLEDLEVVLTELSVRFGAVPGGK